MALLIILITLAAVGIQEIEAIGKLCPSYEWTLHEGTCYLILGSSYSWSDGHQMCKNLAGDMVLPASQEENDFVQQAIYANWNPFDGRNPNPWVRCFRKDGQRVCSEDPGPYSNWSPDHTDVGDCAVMIFTLGVWRGLGCSEERKVMCAAKPDSCARSLSCAMVSNDQQPLCLTNHTTVEFIVKSHIECCIACSEDPTCRSLNLAGQMCQLNSATAAEVGDKYLNKLDNCANYEYKLK